MMSYELPLFYESDVVWEVEKRGRLLSPGLPEIEVATPPEFHGPKGYWSPEHLFVAAVNACFMSTFLAIAASSKLEFEGFSCNARGRLGKTDDAGYQMTEVVLTPKLVVPFASDRDRAIRILEKAERSCIISNSIRSRVDMEIRVLCEEEQAVWSA